MHVFARKMTRTVVVASFFALFTRGHFHTLGTVDFADETVVIGLQGRVQGSRGPAVADLPNDAALLHFDGKDLRGDIVVQRRFVKGCGDVLRLVTPVLKNLEGFFARGDAVFLCQRFDDLENFFDFRSLFAGWAALRF